MFIVAEKMYGYIIAKCDTIQEAKALLKVYGKRQVVVTERSGKRVRV